MKLTKGILGNKNVGILILKNYLVASCINYENYRSNTRDGFIFGVLRLSKQNLKNFQEANNVLVYHSLYY